MRRAIKPFRRVQVLHMIAGITVRQARLAKDAVLKKDGLNVRRFLYFHARLD